MKTHIFALLVVALLLAGSSWGAAPALPSVPAKTYKITNFGGVADGRTDNAAALEGAIKAATAGGGTGQVEHRGDLPVQMCFPNGTIRLLISSQCLRGRTCSNAAIVLSGVAAET
jgi:hypothetical protein